MQTLPVEPSVELPMGPRNAVLCGVDASGPCHRSLRWSSVWGNEALFRVALTHADPASGSFGGAP
eukprot:5058232-Pyramimonas_sp.AAC.1